ncbi:MAG TPA: putative metal-binding protein [Candidatus Limnocylindrales bacterium]
MTSQYVDPVVSRTKFDREIDEYRSLEAGYRGRGWLLVDATFPVVRVVLCATRLRPAAVITGVELNYTNYDEEPPSVRLIDPFTGDPYPFGQLPTTLKRRTLGPPIDIPGIPKGADGKAPRMMGEQPLMQASSAEEIPFLCIAGVREYHVHPAHSGDSWDLHRPGGAGRLVRLLEVIDTYGVRPISNYNIALVPQVTGFVQDEMPE